MRTFAPSRAKPKPLSAGTEGSNPALSSRESGQNSRISEIRICDGSQTAFHPEPDDPAARCAAEDRPPVLENVGADRFGPRQSARTP